MSTITTYTRKHFDPVHPDPGLLCVEDFAHALPMICRGNGHVTTFWSVGEHCICCAKEAAEIMKLTAADLYELGIIEKVIPEYPVINENNIKRVTLYMKRMICDFMYRYIDMDKEELARQRYNRFRKM